MTSEIVVQLRSSCETFAEYARQKHNTATRGEQGDTSLGALFHTHPDIEVDFSDGSTAVVQVQAQLLQAQAFLQKVAEVVLQKVPTGPLLDGAGPGEKPARHRAKDSGGRETRGGGGRARMQSSGNRITEQRRVRRRRTEVRLAGGAREG